MDYISEILKEDGLFEALLLVKQYL